MKYLSTPIDSVEELTLSVHTENKRLILIYFPYVKSINLSCKSSNIISYLINHLSYLEKAMFNLHGEVRKKIFDFDNLHSREVGISPFSQCLFHVNDLWFLKHTRLLSNFLEWKQIGDRNLGLSSHFSCQILLWINNGMQPHRNHHRCRIYSILKYLS